MIAGILAKKLGMTQIFKDGHCIPVTLLEAGPCTVLQVKKTEKDGYCALQLGFDEKRKKSANKPETGHAEKHAHTGPKNFVREVAWDGKDEIAPGQVLTVSVLEKMTYVDALGMSKGKGFQGGVKRYHFKGGPKTHGQSDRLRAVGSLSGSSNPSRVHKGTRMPGHMGHDHTTLHNLKIVDIDAQANLVAVEGSVPGYSGSYVVLRRSYRNK
jgi:large subunit ribosomal protein L3